MLTVRHTDDFILNIWWWYFKEPGNGNNNYNINTAMMTTTTQHAGKRQACDVANDENTIHTELWNDLNTDDMCIINYK